MKYLGIDYGTKRVGIATSDDGGTMAFPFRVIPFSKTLLEDIATICRDEHIDAIVMGESRDLMGKPNRLMDAITPFVASLKERTGLPVLLMPEVLSSREAMHIQGDNDANDASAATIVLQSYLDRTNPRTADDPDEE